MASYFPQSRERGFPTFQVWEERHWSNWAKHSIGVIWIDASWRGLVERSIPVGTRRQKAKSGTCRRSHDMLSAEMWRSMQIRLALSFPTEAGRDVFQTAVLTSQSVGESETLSNMGT